MSGNNRLTEWLRPFDLLWDHIRRYFQNRKGKNRNSPIQLMVYRGFCSREQLWLKGRVLEDRLIVARHEDSAWRNLVNSYKRFSSREIWGAELRISLNEDTFQLKTDREGYFELIAKPPDSFLYPPKLWLYPTIELIGTPWTKIQHNMEAEVLHPLSPRFGIISDIDDTILRTGVTSRLMWRAIYRTILKNAASRVIFKEVSAFFRAMSGYDKTETAFNPVFYVSNSPWNLYDLINDFLGINKLPKGPILLRDIGLPANPYPEGYKGHKYESIARIFRTYPQLDFVLIGDSGEHDADIYLEITQHFPGRVPAIYIRDVQHRKRSLRVKKLIESSGRTEVKLLNHFGEAIPHADELGLLKEQDYWQLFNRT